MLKQIAHSAIAHVFTNGKNVQKRSTTFYVRLMTVNHRRVLPEKFGLKNKSTLQLHFWNGFGFIVLWALQNTQCQNVTQWTWQDVDETGFMCRLLYKDMVHAILKTQSKVESGTRLKPECNKKQENMCQQNSENQTPGTRKNKQYDKTQTYWQNSKTLQSLRKNWALQ